MNPKTQLGHLLDDMLASLKGKTFTRTEFVTQAKANSIAEDTAAKYLDDQYSEGSLLEVTVETYKVVDG